MKPSLRFIAIPLFAALLCAGQAAAASRPELRFVLKNEELPSTRSDAVPRFQQALGTALARQLGRKVRFISLPRKRMVAALEEDKGDILCGYTPEWMPGGLEWGHPFIPVSDVVLSSARVPAPARIEDLRGKRIGTVLGFHYPDMEKGLGADFVRDDAPTIVLSLRKWQLGRFDYVLMPRAVVDKQADKGALPAGYHLMVVNEIKTMCAVPPHGHVAIGDVNAAIDTLEKSGEMARILHLR